MEATAKVRAAIVGSDMMPYEAIVGRDFLDQPHVMLIKRQNSVVIRGLPTMEIMRKNVLDVYAMDGASRIEQIVFGDVDDREKEQCRDLIRLYSDCIWTSMWNLGKTNTVKMEIRCTTDTPVCYDPYRMAQVERGVARKIIAELIDNGIVRESVSPHSSPITMVNKKTGDKRLCVDYRRLNMVTIKNRYPLPLIEDQIDRLGGNKYFTALDLATGYYQVPMDDASIEKTAFVTPDGHNEFLIMPFRLSNAPAVF